MRALLVTDSPGLRDAFRQAILSLGVECGPEDCVPLTGAQDRLAQVPADLVLVHVQPGEQAGLAVIRSVSGQFALPVLAIGPLTDPQQLLLALRSGAREFLDQEKARDELTAALDKLRQVDQLDYRVGKTIAVVASNPGSGVTTVASNLAFALAVKHPGRVALAELGTGVPELALDLDLKPTHNLADLVREYSRMDSRMLRQALVEHSGGVKVLAQPPETLTPLSVEPPAMRHTVLLLRNLFDFTVLDLGHSPHPAAMEAMGLADGVIVVVRLDVPSLRLSYQFLRTLVRQGLAADRIRVVANRYGQSGQLSWKQMEKAIGMPVSVWLPEDTGSVNEALNHGQPVILRARRARLTKRIGELADQLNGQKK